LRIPAKSSSEWIFIDLDSASNLHRS